MSNPPFELPPILLASKSPRRQELLGQMGFDFTVLAKEIDESFPADLAGIDVAGYIASKKMEEFTEESKSALVITADTVVVVDNIVLGKPVDAEDARRMLRMLSGRTHEVFTGICLKYQDIERSNLGGSIVRFAQLSEKDISYYIDNGNPMDKAGAYGIQDWIGLTSITKIEGSYSNVVGLPTHLVYAELSAIANLIKYANDPTVERKHITFTETIEMPPPLSGSF